MRPRLFSLGEAGHAAQAGQGLVRASMRPRLFSLGEGRTGGAISAEGLASMRPRLFSLGEVAKPINTPGNTPALQ